MLFPLSSMFTDSLKASTDVEGGRKNTRGEEIERESEQAKQRKNKTTDRLWLRVCTNRVHLRFETCSSTLPLELC